MRKVGSDDKKRQNKNSIMAQIDRLGTKLEDTSAVIFIHKKSANNADKSHR